jgi:cell division protein FtsB
MKAKRETPKRRDGTDLRRGRDGSARKGRRATADAASSRRTRPGQTSAPAREARAPKSGPQTSPIARPVERSARPASRSQAKARAKARKAKAPKAVRPRLTERLAARLASIDLRPRTLASKVPFVVLVIGSLGLGLGLTLWLSTDSAERSYQLSHARQKNRMLQQQKEALERDVRVAESAPALAEAARKQGMIPTRDTAHLVQDPTGSWVVVGTPKPADGVPPPPLNAKLPDEGPPPPPKPPLLPPEVPVRVQPSPGDPLAPARSGPEALLRAPDGSATVGGQHLPQTAPRLPGMPGGQVAGQVPGTMPIPGLPAPVAPVIAPVPAEVPIPMGGLPLPVPGQIPPPLPAEVPVPVQRGMVPQAPQGVVPAFPGAPVLAPVPQPAVPQPVPPNGGQFGPATGATPGVRR